MVLMPFSSVSRTRRIHQPKVPSPHSSTVSRTAKISNDSLFFIQKSLHINLGCSVILSELFTYVCHNSYFSSCFTAVYIQAVLLLLSKPLSRIASFQLYVFLTFPFSIPSLPKDIPSITRLHNTFWCTVVMSMFVIYK